MIKEHIYYLTVPDGTVLYGKLDFYQYQGEDIFSFLFNYSGDRFDIIKKNGIWTYKGGIANYPSAWVRELGTQIDLTNHF